MLAAAVVGATFAGISLPAAATPSMDQSWMTAGHTLQFQVGTASDGAQTSGTFSVIVHAADASSVTFDFISGAPPKVQQITYARDTRTATNPGGAGHAWLFINQADIDRGYAYIGGEYAALTPLSNPAFAQFSTSEQNFHFDTATGLLLMAQDAGSGSMITRIASSPGLVIPPPDNDPDPTMQVTPAIAPGQVLGVLPEGGSDGESEEGHLSTMGVIRFLRIPCDYRNNYPTLRPLGVTQTCDGTFNVPLTSGGFSIPSPDIWWPLFADGSITMTISDAVGTYYGAGCASVLPATSGNSVACTGGLLRSVVGWGTHTVNVRGNFGHCLNPVTLFGCPWAWNTLIDGDVTCGRNCEYRPI